MIEVWTTHARNLQHDIESQYPPVRGRVKGPAYRNYSIAPNTTDSFSEVFYASELAQVTLLTNQANVELTITLDKQSLCKLESSQEAMHCSWTPLYTAPHNLVITNNSNEHANYIVVSN
jgi:hypothetical protein